MANVFYYVKKYKGARGVGYHFDSVEKISLTEFEERFGESERHTLLSGDVIYRNKSVTGMEMFILAKSKQQTEVDQ